MPTESTSVLPCERELETKEVAVLDTKFGKTPDQWQRNVAVTTGALRAVAASRATTTYKVLAGLIGQDVSHRHELAHLLGEIASNEHSAKRPLLSAVVVLKSDKKPGIGFAGIARDLGIEVPEGQEVSFWIEQLFGCWDHWGSR